MGLDLVTGALGFSGAHVVRTLLGAGHRVLATDHPAAFADPRRLAVARLVGFDPDRPGVVVAPADLLDAGAVSALFRHPVRRVFHTASLYDYSASLERLRRVNVDGTRNLLAAAATAPIERLVHWSTCGVFGKPVPVHRGSRGNLPFTERSPSPRNSPEGAAGPAGTGLVNAYSVSKWEQEGAVWRAARAGLPVTVVRPAPVYGPGSDYGHGGIVLAVARGLVPAIPKDARNAINASVHVEDVARFALHAADRADALGEDYNVVDDSVISYGEFLHAIALLTGRRMWDVPLVPLAAVRAGAETVARCWTALEKRFGVPRVRILEVQSAAYIGSSYWISNRKSLGTGFRYRYADVREGLKDTIAWMREVGWIDRSPATAP